MIWRNENETVGEITEEELKGLIKKFGKLKEAHSTQCWTGENGYTTFQNDNAIYRKEKIFSTICILNRLFHELEEYLGVSIPLLFHKLEEYSGVSIPFFGFDKVPFLFYTFEKTSEKNITPLVIKYGDKILIVMPLDFDEEIKEVK